DDLYLSEPFQFGGMSSDQHADCVARGAQPGQQRAAQQTRRASDEDVRGRERLVQAKLLVSTYVRATTNRFEPGDHATRLLGGHECLVLARKRGVKLENASVNPWRCSERSAEKPADVSGHVVQRLCRVDHGVEAGRDRLGARQRFVHAADLEKAVDVK